MRDGELASVTSQPSVLAEQDLPVKQVSGVAAGTAKPGEEELVPC
jgi:hypothetical protein